jgi:hypothetical protein
MMRAVLLWLYWLTPAAAIDLFNGSNFDGRDIFIKDRGRNQDPNRVFQVENGVIHVSGTEFGYILTQKEYSNYYLSCEFKWGEATHAPRKDKAGDSGILFHVTGPDMIWPRSIEYQFIEGGTGDI